MRTAFISAAASVLLVGCGKASASPPDSPNPVHCFAAFNYAAYWFKVGKEPTRETEMLARAQYELDRAKRAGIRDPLSEAKDLIRAHGKNDKEMDSLFLGCSKAQNLDDNFRAELPKLMVRAQTELLPKYEVAATP